MPLLHFHVIKGRKPEAIRALLDTAHEAMLEAFKVPARDRYQIVTEHERDHMVIEDTGLGIPRTDQVVLLQITSRPRSKEQITAFYSYWPNGCMNAVVWLHRTLWCPLCRMQMNTGALGWVAPSL